jgi:hypothetical protein
VFQDVFQITHLSFAQWVTVMKFSLPVILLDEALKFFARWTFHFNPFLFGQILNQVSDKISLKTANKNFILLNVLHKRQKTNYFIFSPFLFARKLRPKLIRKIVRRNYVDGRKATFRWTELATIVVAFVAYFYAWYQHEMMLMSR